MADRSFKLPDLGEGVHEGQVVAIHVRAGEMVKEDEPLMEVETDKAAVEIPSPYTGVVREVHVAAQQVVNVGAVLVTFGDDGADDGRAVVEVKREPTAVAASAAAPTGATMPAPTPTPATPGRRPKPASPAVRKLAREMGLDLETIEGSGPGGRICRVDVQRAASAPTVPAPPPPPVHARPAMPIAPLLTDAPAPVLPEPIEPPGADGNDQYGPIRRHPLTQARKTIARVMSESWSTIPHVTDSHDADVTELDQLRRGYAAPDDPRRKLTLLPFVVRAVARALHRFPAFNASFDADAGEIVYRRYVNIAVGVHTERGLIAPVIRDAERLGIAQLADALAEIAEKARTASFAVNDTRGGTYTISNPGALGGTRYSTPIITPPQVAVLALGRARRHAWVVDGEVVPRLIMPLSHSFDHRIIDGGDEVAFMKHIVDDLENPARLVL